MSSPKSPAKYFIGLLVLFLVLSGVMTLFSVNTQSSLARSEENLAAVSAATITKIPNPNITITSIQAKMDAGNKPFFDFKICSNNTSSLADIGMGALTLSSYTYSVAGQPSKYQTTSASGASIVGLKNGACSLWTNYTLTAEMAQEYTANPKIIFVIDRFFSFVGRATTATTTNTLILANASSITATPIDNGINPVVAYTANFSVTLQNNGTTNLYVSAVNGAMFTKTANPANASTSVISVMPTITALPGDTISSYIIPAASTRTFNALARITKKVGYTSQRLTITGVKYGSTAGTYGKTVTAGLGGLYKIVTF